jgi:Glyoxalase/Bleomycin resistance protein/Dioxygenase superfamily
MYKVLHISPMIPSFDLSKTVAFFCDLLDFSPIMNEKEYAVLQRNDQTIHVLPAGAEIGEMEFYLEVDDVDGLWEKIKPHCQNFKCKEPFDREYGMREIHIIVPNTKTLMFIGQPIRDKNQFQELISPEQ